MTGHPHVATVVCGECEADGRPRPGVLGTVEEWASGPVWVGHNPRRPRSRMFREAGLRNVHYVPLWVPDVEDELPVYCRNHGIRRVQTTDVLAARGRIAVNIGPRRK